MLEIVPADTAFDFVGKRHAAFLVSGCLVGVGVLLLVLVGPRYGVDFAGGTLLHVRAASPVSLEHLRRAFEGLDTDVELQDASGTQREFLLRIADTGDALERAVGQRIEAAFGPGRYEILRNEVVGPRVGADLRRQALFAMIAAIGMMGTYVAWRFEPRFGVGAALALVHDVIVTLGALIACRYEIDMTIVAALLTVVGFSVNDTVIVSDRVRENRRKHYRRTLPEIINLSINETLSRTVLTTGTALLVILALLSLGGPVIRGFAVTLLVGITVGTYSSIFVALPIVLTLARTPRR